MTTYRVLTHESGIASLQRRRMLLLWETIKTGTLYNMTAAAIHFEKTKKIEI